MKKPKYKLNANGRFVIENYNDAKPFSNFFPGVAGLWGKPMWVFYVNRGQCISSFGIESKSNSIMEFQPANKAYRLTSSQGYRTFIKVTTGSKVEYWEPFQENRLGTDYAKNVSMSISSHDLVLEETNTKLGLKVTVTYFTLPEEPFSALVRNVSIQNLKKTKRNVEIVDGLPIIVPFGLKDDVNKNMSRTVEAWIKVRNLDKKAPFYQLNVEIDDKPEVTHIEQGNFFFAFDGNAETAKLLEPIAEAANVFGQSSDYSAPEKFLAKSFKLPKKQQTSNRTPSAFCHKKFTLKPSAEESITSIYGNAQNVKQLNGMVKRVAKQAYIALKEKRNKEIIDEIKNFAFTNSSSNEFNLYSGATFLDNVLRGGLPVSLQTAKGDIAFNVYSRKHGDPERDYNWFTVAPTFFSQGNGNYRDVNQNRRNDVWFNKDVRQQHLVNFLNLSQADGYNPLVVMGTTFAGEDKVQMSALIKEVVADDYQTTVLDYVMQDFRPGDLLDFIASEDIKLKVQDKEFLGRVLNHCSKQELANHGEGFWTDHWHYNLDLIESYLSVYPEHLRNLLLETDSFSFYHNAHYVLPRDERYILTERGVRQYEALGKIDNIDSDDGKNDKLKTKNGEGVEYQTHLTSKLLCLIANKVATLDPSGIGVDMEADKPNWYDSLNGLPGLLGSAISETLEIQRFAEFLLDSFKTCDVKDSDTIHIFDELASFISGLTNLLSLESDDFAYWQKSNDIKEHYRQCVRKGIDGKEVELSVESIKQFLNAVIKKTTDSTRKAKNKKGFLTTYLYHDVIEHQVIDKSQQAHDTYVRPLKFKRHDLPLFLEGYVHKMRVENDTAKARKTYAEIRKTDLFDKKLKMYKVNTDLSTETEEIGRTRIFPASWLENESVWLHMEYKFILELLRNDLNEEYYDNFAHVLVPFLKPAQYGRSVLENSSFIVSSAHEDDSLHGQGFVARLSGSTAEFLHMWLYMNVGRNPFQLDAKGDLVVSLQPALTGDLFTKKTSQVDFFQFDQWEKYSLPKNTYAFNFLGNTLVVYHNAKRLKTFGAKKAKIKSIELQYPDKTETVVLSSATIPSPYAEDIRERKLKRIDVTLA